MGADETLTIWGRLDPLPAEEQSSARLAYGRFQALVGRILTAALKGNLHTGRVAPTRWNRQSERDKTPLA